MAAYSGALPTMGQFRAVWPYALWGVMSVSVAYVFQVMAQKSTPAASAALIMQFQSVIAAICGVLFLGESMTGLMAFGAFLMVAGSLVAQRAPDPVRILPEHRFFKKLMAARVALAIAILAICVAAVALTG
jgi:drug/metabolite transporter (DMT)-like permease